MLIETPPDQEQQKLFKRSLIPQLNQQLLDLSTRERINMSSKASDTGSKKWTKEKIEQIFKRINKFTKLHHLWLHWNHMQKICSLVVKPVYDNLKLINLGGNDILSIEPLIHSKMEHLEQLWLWNNKITRVDCLRKMYAPKLIFLDISNNHVLQWPKFGQLHTHSLLIINIQNNKFNCINNFVKNIDFQSECTLKLLDNQLVKVFNKSVHGRRKDTRAHVYQYQLQELKYV